MDLETYRKSSKNFDVLQYNSICSSWLPSFSDMKYLTNSEFRWPLYDKVQQTFAFFLNRSSHWWTFPHFIIHSLKSKVEGLLL
jgi:hypothetical protein